MEVRFANKTVVENEYFKILHSGLTSFFGFRFESVKDFREEIFCGKALVKVA